MSSRRARTSGCFVAVLLLMSFAFAGRAAAASFTVTSTTDAVDQGGCVTVGVPCTLRDAVIAANQAGGSSTITVPAGTYTLTILPSGADDATTGDLNIAATVTINGAGAGSTIIDGGGDNGVTDRVLRVEHTGNLTLSGVTIRGGHPAGSQGSHLAEGGGILAFGPLTISDATITGNTVDPPNGAGAGVSQESDPTNPVNVPVSLTSVTVSNNTAGSTGAAVGGGLFLNAGGTSPLTITDSTISGNSAMGAGGGLYLSAPLAAHAQASITGTTISGNHAVLPSGASSTSEHAYGGGLATDGTYTMTLDHDAITNNTADQAGGAILDNGSSTYTITDTTISGNSAVAGVTGPGNFLGGGGITADGGNTNPGWKLSGDTISGNRAGDANHPGVPGGGINEDGGDKFTVVNTTIVGNSASGPGGGYQSDGGGTHNLTNVTIDSNTSGTSGGNISNTGAAAFSLANTIVARGTPDNCAPSNGLPKSSGHNLDTGSSCGFNATGDLSNQANPGLGPLADNGGPTKTEALLNGSSAIDAGDNALCPATDQRGAARPAGPACDIGAYERLQSPFVTNSNDSGPGSLRDAIAFSESGDNIDFAPSLNGQTITLTSGPLVIRHSLTISGPGAKNLTVNGNQNGTMFDIEANQFQDDVAISGLTITGGAFDGSGASGGGGIFDNTASLLTLSGVTVTGNQATVSSADSAGGGGVYANGGKLTVTNSTVTDNRLTLTGGHGGGNGGGGINSDGGSLTIDGSTVSGNTVVQKATSSSCCDGGGGIYSNGGTLTVSNSTVNNNSDSVDSSQTGSAGGGGIYSNGGTLTISNSTVNNNSDSVGTSQNGSAGGGGIYSDGGTLTLSNSTVNDNSESVGSDQGGSDGGGGIYDAGGAISMSADTVNGNGFTLANSTVSDNGGGGVYSEGGGVTVSSSSVDANTATIANDTSQQGRNGGGGLYSEGGIVVVTASSISANAGNITATAGGNGGGAVFDEGRDTTYINSTLSDNSMKVTSPGGENGGGAIAGIGGNTSTFSLIDVTVAGNTIDEPGGAIFDRVGTYKFKNTILAGNSGSSAGNCAAGTTGPTAFQSEGFNLESANTCGLTQSTDLTNTDPKLGPLQNNGGPTPTQALLAGSPAIDSGSCTDVAGNPVSTDQRGVARPQPAGGKCDIGAFELAAAPPGGAGGGSPPGGTAGTSSPPAVVTGAPEVQSSTKAIFAGDVNPSGLATTAFFQYGLDTVYNAAADGPTYTATTPIQQVGSDFLPHPVSASVGGLVPNAVYHVRLVAVNAAGTTYGPDQTFRTKRDPPPPPPVLGKSVDVVPVSGLVFIKLPEAGLAAHLPLTKGVGFVPLTEARQLPAGSQVDARLGTLELSSAAPQHGKLQTGTFGGGLFGFAQDRSGTTKGLTTLSLLEGAFPGAPTYASCKRKASDQTPTQAQTAVSSQVLQTLRASAHGHFRTRGRYSAATVRGTAWTTSDRCDGTLTSVQRHTVLVTDFVRHISVIVRAGHSYLARPAPARHG